MKALLVEDDRDLAAKLLRVLHADGFAVDVVHNGEDALYLGGTGNYDCVVLDIGIPKIDGIEVLAELRRLDKDFPVLMLTARDGWADKSAAFKAGADDYLAKPFIAQELIARLHALARRNRGHNTAQIACGALTYRTLTRSFFLDGQPLHLTAFERRILEKLIQFPESVVDRATLFECVYEYREVQDVPVRSFEVLMGRLRRKIGFEMIETLRGQGYRLTAGAK